MRKRRWKRLAIAFALFSLVVFFRLSGVAGVGTIALANVGVTITLVGLVILLWVIRCRSTRFYRRWQRRTLWAMGLGRCAYCKNHTSFRLGEADHIWPWSMFGFFLGGRRPWWGLTSVLLGVWSCKPCNGAKSAQLPQAWMRDFYRRHGAYPKMPWRVLLVSRKVRRQYRKAPG